MDLSETPACLTWGCIESSTHAGQGLDPRELTVFGRIKTCVAQWERRHFLSFSPLGWPNPCLCLSDRSEEGPAVPYTLRGAPGGSKDASGRFCSRDTHSTLKMVDTHHRVAVSQSGQELQCTREPGRTPGWGLNAQACLSPESVTADTKSEVQGRVSTESLRGQMDNGEGARSHQQKSMQGSENPRYCLWLQIFQECFSFQF